MTRRIVIIGTGTGVGKTWVARSLAALIGEQRSVVALKPVVSGVAALGSGGPPSERSDGALLRDVSTRAVAPGPFRFGPALSPHLAARGAGASIDLSRILRYVQEHDSSSPSPADSVTIVETAGGLFTPLAVGLTTFDLARALDPSTWILVGPESLGVLHDVTATIGHARGLGRVPDYVVLSGARPPDASTGANASELSLLGVAERLITAPHGDPEPLRALVRELLTETAG
jgi:dethiobiotin synthetase